MKHSRDLFLLSTIAFRQGKHQDAGSLFAAAMSATDSEEFLNLLNEENTVTASTLLSIASDIELDLESACASFTSSLSSSGEDEDEFNIEDEDSGDEDEDSGDEDEADFDDEDAGDDISSSMPGQRILPSSLSSNKPAKEQKPTTGSRIVVSSSLKSPVRIKG